MDIKIGDEFTYITNYKEEIGWDTYRVAGISQDKNYCDLINIKRPDEIVCRDYRVENILNPSIFKRHIINNIYNLWI